MMGNPFLGSIERLPEISTESASPPVWAVVLNWRDGAATLACLDQLANADYPNLRVVVVDNGSTDGSLELIAQRPKVHVIRNGANLGFTAGVNVGIHHAIAQGASFVWLVNSDALVPPHVLTNLVSLARSDEQIGLVSPVFHDPDHPDRAEWLLARFDPDSRTASQTADPDVAAQWMRHPTKIIAIGTAMLIRRQLIEAIGGLDERFFAYVEDVDYSLRCQAAGFEILVDPASIVFHKFKDPVGRAKDVPPYLHYFMTRNPVLLWRKLPGPLIWRRASLWFLRERLLQLVRLQGDDNTSAALLAGLWDGLRGASGPYDPKRRMPGPLAWIVRRHAEFLLALLELRVRKPRRS